MIEQLKRVLISIEEEIKSENSIWNKEQLISIIKPEFEELYREYSRSMTLNRKTVGFVTSFSKIKSIFNESERIFNCLFGFDDEAINNYKIDRPIYIEENNAIFEIISPTSSNLYYLRFYEGVVQINWLGGVIE